MPDEPLARSSREGQAGQLYRSHAEEVRDRAQRDAKAAGHPAVEEIAAAGEYHDLGKLDGANQAVLSGRGRAKRLPVNHVDAGCAHLIAQGRIEAALAVYSHHRGLPSIPSERAKGSDAFRDMGIAKQVDRTLPNLLAAHRQAVGERQAASSAPPPWNPAAEPMRPRIGLSCLVDADHSSAAGDSPLAEIGLRPLERLAALDTHVASLGAGKGDETSRLRQALYEAARGGSAPGAAIQACDAPVGSGKTTALMARALRIAQAENLRRVFVVLPYTAIIAQSVETYRKALALPGEIPEAVVAEHHHKVDFEAPGLRRYATTWNSPIVVTTAVQFFETLASSKPGKLRKLHALPRSAVIVDEVHAALPAAFWPVTWSWMRELAERWGVRWLLASGSLPRLWSMPELAGGLALKSEEVPDIAPSAVRLANNKRHAGRVRFQRNSFGGVEEWAEAIRAEKRGPALAIANRLRTAAQLCLALRGKGVSAEHVSTALAPRDREKVLLRVRRRLEEESDRDWALVGTSCLEAGLDFDFAVAWRENAGLQSLLQTSGRANRHGRPEPAPVHSVDGIGEAPSYCRPAANVLGRFWDDLTTRTPIEAVTQALRVEIQREGQDQQAGRLVDAQRAADYPEVARLYQIIDDITATVVVDSALAGRMAAGDPSLRPIEVVRASVQLPPGLLRKAREEELVAPIEDGADDEPPEAWEWLGAYDPEGLGVMAAPVWC